MTEIKTTIIITTAATAAAVTTVTNWIKKSLCLNRISKEIKTEIKCIYDEATHFFNTHFIKKKINRQKTATNELKLQSVYNKSFVVQQTHKMYSVICTHNLSVFTQQSYLNRIVCSALKTVCAVFFDLIFFFHIYQERSFFFFFSINLKEITICNVSTDLMKQWKSNNNNKADAAATARKEI